MIINYSSATARVSVDEMQRDLSACLQRVEKGETLVILKEDNPIAEIVPVFSNLKKPRPFGLCAGEFVVPDDFDAPLPENIIKEFEGWNSLPTAHCRPPRAGGERTKL